MAGGFGYVARYSRAHPSRVACARAVCHCTFGLRVPPRAPYLPLARSTPLPLRRLPVITGGADGWPVLLLAGVRPYVLLLRPV